MTMREIATVIIVKFIFNSIHFQFNSIVKGLREGLVFVDQKCGIIFPMMLELAVICQHLRKN